MTRNSKLLLTAGSLVTVSVSAILLILVGNGTFSSPEVSTTDGSSITGDRFIINDKRYDGVGGSCIVSSNGTLTLILQADLNDTAVYIKGNSSYGTTEYTITNSLGMNVKSQGTWNAGSLTGSADENVRVKVDTDNNSITIDGRLASGGELTTIDIQHQCDIEQEDTVDASNGEAICNSISLSKLNEITSTLANSDFITGNASKDRCSWKAVDEDRIATGTSLVAEIKDVANTEDPSTYSSSSIKEVKAMGGIEDGWLWVSSNDGENSRADDKLIIHSAWIKVDEAWVHISQIPMYLTSSELTSIAKEIANNL